MFGSDKGPIRAVVSLGGLGLTLGIFTALGTLLGYYLDERWNTTPWLTLTGILLGMAAGFFEVITMVRRVERQDPRGRGGHGGAAPHRDR